MQLNAANHWQPVSEFYNVYVGIKHLLQTQISGVEIQFMVMAVLLHEPVHCSFGMERGLVTVQLEGWEILMAKLGIITKK